MRIRQIVALYGRSGGIETHIFDVTEALEHAGHRCVVGYGAPGTDHARRLRARWAAAGTAAGAALLRRGGGHRGALPSFGRAVRMTPFAARAWSGLALASTIGRRSPI